MSIVIDATVGGPTSNSYLTLSEAEQYFAGRYGSETWATLDDDKKNACLVTFTNRVEELQFAGYKDSYSQALSWPRTGIVDRDGQIVSSVPNMVKQAVCEWALWTITEDDRMLSDFDLNSLESAKIGPLDVTVKSTYSSEVPQTVLRKLNAIADDVILSNVSNSAKSVKVFR